MDLQLKHWLVLAASPRPLGNSERAADLAATSLRHAGLAVDILRLREHVVAPCTACGLCSVLPGACSLDPDRTGQPDDAAAIFARMHAAAGLLVIAPVYFYGLPAPFKALVDRSQRYWGSDGGSGEDGPASGPHVLPKPAYALLPAGRIKGERLFDGSLLSLRPFLRLLGFSLSGHLPLRGLDAADALDNRPDQRALIQDFVLRFAAD